MELTAVQARVRWVVNPYVCGGITLLLSSFAAHLTYGHLYYAGAVVGAVCTTALGLLSGWIMRGHHERLDSYQAHTYYQNMKTKSALTILYGIIDGCDHNCDAGHEQCRAAFRKQLLIIKSAMGNAPMPELVKGKLSGCKAKECFTTVCPNFQPFPANKKGTPSEDRVPLC